jgi:NAD(P)-dependent dehydrogenase (short-subunit alcohol dehydrogenase family)/acyl carrier protein
VRSGKAAQAGYRRDASEVSARLERAYAAAADDITELFLEGVAIEWDRLYAGGTPVKVALPTYPFERQRYWVETPGPEAAAATATVAPERYEMVWERLAAADGSLERCRERRWTIVAGDEDLAAQVRTVLSAHGANVALAGTDVLYLCGDGTIEGAAESCAELLRVVHAVLDAGGAVPRIWVVTRGAVPATIAPTEGGAAQAPVAAFARVLGLEHPELFGRVIDLDPVRGADDAAALLSEILRADDDAGDDQVALRGGARYGQRIDRLSGPLAAPEALRPDRTYLVSGGLGRIGLLMAGDLVHRGARHLCLLSRHGVSTDVQRLAVAALESEGADVRIVTGDVADRAAMSALVDSMPDALPLAGVVHAAGLPGYTSIAELTDHDVHAVLRPKVHGAWNLHELTRNRTLDFFVCCSSIASAWGSRGQAHYAAGNAFLDVLAHLRRAAGLTSVTVNWGPWVEGGMTSPEAETLLRRVGIRPLATGDALAAFASLACGDRAQVVVADIDWHLFRGSYEARGQRHLLDRLATGAGLSAASVENPLVKRITVAAPGDREGLLVDVVRQEVAGVLAVPDPSRVDPTQGLFDMGLDSLMALELRTRLETLVSRSLPATLVFDAPTIQAIARYLLDGMSVPAAGVRPPMPEAAPAEATTPDTPPVDVDALSDEDAEALLLKRLESIH